MQTLNKVFYSLFVGALFFFMAKVVYLTAVATGGI